VPSSLLSALCEFLSLSLSLPLSLCLCLCLCLSLCVCVSFLCAQVVCQSHTQICCGGTETRSHNSHTQTLCHVLLLAVCVCVCVFVCISVLGVCVCGWVSLPSLTPLFSHSLILSLSHTHTHTHIHTYTHTHTHTVAMHRVCIIVKQYVHISHLCYTHTNLVFGRGESFTWKRFKWVINFIVFNLF